MSDAMNPELVDRLEEAIEQALAEAFAGFGRPQVPRRPDRRLRHLMAKAAVAVYEASAARRPDPPRRA